MKLILSLLVLVLLLLLFSICGKPQMQETTIETISPAATQVSEPEGRTAQSPTPTPPLVPEDELLLVAKVLRGECYDDQLDDKREVVKVICNRVSAGEFGDSVKAIIPAPRQFAGYRPDNVPTESDIAIAREVLTLWYESGCLPLGEYLFFTAGDGHRNVFRKDW